MKADLYAYGCMSAQKGAKEVSFLQVHGPATVWRSILKDLPHRDRTRHVRRQGFVVTIDLEALTQVKERRLSADTIVAGMSMHPPSGRPKATQVCLQNRLLRPDREQRARDRIRERQNVTSLLETLESSSSGGTEPCQGVTTDDVQVWQSTGLSEANIDRSKDISVRETPQTQLCAMSSKNQTQNPHSKENGFWIVVPDRIFGQEIRALIDSGTTQCFISLAGVTKCDLNVESHNTFLELGDGKRCCHKGELSTCPSSQLVTH